MGKDWFEKLFGFVEAEGDVQSLLRVEGDRLVSAVNGASFGIGSFACPSLAELRAEHAARGATESGRWTFRNAVGDAAQFHVDNPGATFQVASQFNALEFVGPTVVPEDGVTGYVSDRTQGPCCAVACGAAAVFRNYFARVGEREGQTRSAQIENLREMLEALQGPAHADGGDALLRVTGGYTLASDAALDAINVTIAALDEAGRDAVRALLRVGAQYDVQLVSSQWGRVQHRDEAHVVTQVFGSACSVSYSRNRESRRRWAPLATLVLEASYEATFLIAAANARRKGAGRAPSTANTETNHRKRLFLTALGGGVFGNELSWVEAAIRRALSVVKADLDVVLVTYAHPVPRAFQALVNHDDRSLPPPSKKPRAD